MLSLTLAPVRRRRGARTGERRGAWRGLNLVACIDGNVEFLRSMLNVKTRHTRGVSL